MVGSYVTAKNLNKTEPFLAKLFKVSAKATFNLSKEQTNPYFAAMLHEIGGLSKENREYVLEAHQKADAFRASVYREQEYTNEYPVDYSTHSASEFLYDEYKAQGAATFGATKFKTPLNGLILIHSLSLLLLAGKYNEDLV